MLVMQNSEVTRVSSSPILRRISVFGSPFVLLSWGEFKYIVLSYIPGNMVPYAVGIRAVCSRYTDIQQTYVFETIHCASELR